MEPLQHVMVGIKPRCYNRLQWGAVLNTLLMKLPSHVRLMKIKDHMMTDIDFNFMYPHLLDKHFCEAVRTAYLSEPWLLLRFTTGMGSPDLITTMRKICGDTYNPEAGSIRHLYGEYKNDELHYNAVHCSDSLVNAYEELKHFNMI